MVETQAQAYESGMGWVGTKIEWSCGSRRVIINK